MKRLLMVAAAVTGISITGLTGSADAGYPVRVPVTQTYFAKPGYGYGNYGSFGGYGNYGSNRGCWTPAPRRNVYRALPYNYGHNCNSSSGYFGGYGPGSNWRW